MEELLHAAVEAARAGGGVVRAALERGTFTVTKKAAADFVTDVDVASERAIVAVIRRAFPDHGLVGEEGGRQEGSSSAGYQWVIDPIDGTTNFIRGIPFFAVAVSVEKDGVPVAAAVLDPSRDELYQATSGGGSWLGSKRLRVSDHDSLAGGLVLTGIPFRGLRRLPAYLPQMERVALAGAGIRRMGSAALDLAALAAGRAEAFWEHGLSRWDVSAGTLLVTEAGGRVSDHSGGATWLVTGDILATNGNVHAAMLECLEPAAEARGH